MALQAASNSSQVISDSELVASGRKMNENCDEILSIWIRILIFSFYQLQFTKPIFYLIMDKDLRKGVKATMKGPQKSIKRPVDQGAGRDDMI